MNKQLKTSGKLTNIIFLVVFSLTMLCLMLFGSWSYETKANHISNWILLPVGLLISCSLYFLCIKLQTVPILITFIIFFIYQIFSVCFYYFATGWDPNNVFSTALQIASHSPEIDPYYTFYFSRYPNNDALLYLLVFFMRPLLSIGMDAQHLHLFFSILQCLLFQLSGLLLFSVCNQLYGKNRAFFAYIIFILLVGVSPWVVILYSDSLGLIFPILIIWIYIKQPKKLFRKILKWFFIGLLTYFAYKVKPQAAIVSIAIIITILFNFIFQKRTTSRKHNNPSSNLSSNLSFILAFIIGFFISAAFVNISIDSLKFQTYDEYNVSPAHYFMLGLNEEHTGVWNSEDIGFSQSIANKSERTSAELERAGERISSMWPLRLIKHTIKKILLNFNDGSFAWGTEGAFWLETYDLNSNVSQVFKDIFYSPCYAVDSAVSHKIWINMSQALWIACLFFSLFSSLPSGEYNDVISVVKLACVGIFLFNMLFEARARYIFTFVPVFILLASSGIENLLVMIKGFIQQRKMS